MTQSKSPFRPIVCLPTVTPSVVADKQSPIRLTVDQALETAITHFRAGRFHDADILTTGILTVQPRNLHALNLMGNIALAVGKAEIALGYFEDACAENPAESAYPFNRGLALATLGRPHEAERFYREALNIDPDYGEAADNLGILLASRGLGDEAIALHRKATSLMPHAFGPLINLAVAMKSMGRLEEARQTLEDARVKHPSRPEVPLELARVYVALDRTDRAEDLLRQAIRMNPGDWQPYNDLGLIMGRRGDSDEAIGLIRQAVDRAPEMFAPTFNLGSFLLNVGAVEEAQAVLRRVLEIDPDSSIAWSLWSECLFQAETIALNDRLVEDIETYLSRSDMTVANVSTCVEDILRRDRVLASLQLMADTGDIVALASELASGRGLKALSRPLLTRFITASRTSDFAIERLLTGVRRAVLRLHETGRLEKVIAAHNGVRFLTALAGHCFLNEYVFDLLDDEAISVESLEMQVSSLIEASENPPPAMVALIACYRPLHQVRGCERLLAMETLTNRPPIKEMLRQQIEEPLAEHRIRAEIPQASAIDDTVSLAVRDQYEQNPYPRWRNLGFVVRESFRAGLRRRFPALRNLALPWPEAARILVAGCGTGQQPLQTALAYEHVSVYGIDLSLSSLAFAERKRREMGVDNLELAQADILKLGDWNDRFDLIECSGVLHHLEDPLKGLQILTGLLNPGGLMRLGLYSEIARRSVIAARSFIAERGYASTPEGIRLCRQELLLLPDDHPAKPVALKFGDFNTVSTCRDLLFHVREHRFTIAKINKALKMFDLEFYGFLLKSKIVIGEYQKRFPLDPIMVDLSCWEQFERDCPDTFKSMYDFMVRKRP